MNNYGFTFLDKNETEITWQELSYFIPSYKQVVEKIFHQDYHPWEQQLLQFLLINRVVINWNWQNF
ncbi:MAG: hypothetical protein HC815_05790 [Richelia sp. RM1_1_1]|nr:hypothetical protein [Richelia sp. RM1_1_1]